MPYRYSLCRQLTPSWLKGCPGVGPQWGEFCILVIKILNLPCEQSMPGQSGIGYPQGVEFEAGPKVTLHWGVLGSPVPPSSEAHGCISDHFLYAAFI
jgi:hypothetical protein